MSLILRPYQREAVDAVFSYWAQGGEHPLLEAATGTGKSVILATLAKELLSGWPDLRILCLVHTRELVEQNAKAMLSVWPRAPIGINSAGLGRRDRRQSILFASIQSVHRSARELGPRDVILIDECHLVSVASETMYARLLGDLRDLVPDLRVAGMSATPYRLQSGRLDEGEGRLFSKIVYSYGITRGIDDGYLAPLITKATVTGFDVSSVAKRGGEFVAGALEAAVDQDWITKAAVEEIITLGECRRSWLVFASGVKHAHHLRDAIRARGISCEAVSGETPSAERDRLIRAFREGRLRCLTNAQVLTTGFDAPVVDMLAVLRPTMSKGLLTQICGRGTRPVYSQDFDPDRATAAERREAIAASVKANCLVLDFAQNLKRLGPIDEINVGGRVSSKSTESTVLAKTCPECQTLVALAALQCPACGHEWLFSDRPKHEASADDKTPILSTGGPAPAWLAVDGVTFHRHVKYGSLDGLPTMRVEYRTGITVYREFICFEHSGYARSKAERWWRASHGRYPVPDTVDEAVMRAMGGEIACPAEIMVRLEGKFFAVVGRRFQSSLEKVA